MASKHSKKKKSLSPHQVDRLLAFLREEDKPLRPTVLAKVLGYSTAKDVNPTLHDLSKQGLVTLVTINSMPMWKIGCGVPIGDLANESSKVKTMENVESVALHSETVLNPGHSSKLDMRNINKVSSTTLSGCPVDVSNAHLTPVRTEICQSNPGHLSGSPSSSNTIPSPVNGVSSMAAPGILHVTPPQTSSDSPFNNAAHHHSTVSFNESRKTFGTSNYNETKRGGSNYNDLQSQGHSSFNDRTNNHSYGHGNHAGNSYPNNSSYQNNTNYQNSPNFPNSNGYPSNRSQHMNVASGNNSFGERSHQNYNPNDRTTHHLNGTYHSSRPVNAYGPSQQQIPPHSNNFVLHQTVSHRGNPGNAHNHAVQPQQQQPPQQAPYQQQQQVTSSYMLPQQPQHPHATLTTTYMMTDQHQQHTGAYPDMATNRYNQSVNNFVSGSQVESAPMQQHQHAHTHNFAHQPQLPMPTKPESYSAYHGVTENKYLSNLHGHGTLAVSSYGQPGGVEDLGASYSSNILNYSQPVANSGDFSYMSNYHQSVTGNAYMGAGGDYNHQVTPQSHSSSSLGSSFQLTDKYGYGPSSSMGTNPNIGTFSCNATTTMGLATIPGTAVVNSSKGSINARGNDFRSPSMIQNSCFKPQTQPYKPGSHSQKDTATGVNSCNITAGPSTVPTNGIFSQSKAGSGFTGGQTQPVSPVSNPSQVGPVVSRTSPSFTRNETPAVPSGTPIPRTSSNMPPHVSSLTTVSNVQSNQNKESLLTSSTVGPNGQVKVPPVSVSLKDSSSVCASQCGPAPVASTTSTQVEIMTSVAPSGSSVVNQNLSISATVTGVSSSRSGPTHSKQSVRNSNTNRSPSLRTNYQRGARGSTGNVGSTGPAFGPTGMCAPYGVNQSYRFSSPWTLNGMNANFATMNLNDKNGPCSFHRPYNKKGHTSGKGNSTPPLSKHRSLLMDQLNPNELLLAYLSLQCHILDPATVFTIHSQRTRADACRVLLDTLERNFRKDLLKCLCEGLTMSGQAYLAKALQFAESKYRQDDSKRKLNTSKNKETSFDKNEKSEQPEERSNPRRKDSKDRPTVEKNGPRDIAQNDKEAKMSLKFLKAIDLSRQEILSSLIPDNDFLRHLVEKKSLTDSEQHRINIMSSRQDKIEALLSWLPKQEDSAFEAFCGALVKAHQPYLAHQLVREVKSAA